MVCKRGLERLAWVHTIAEVSFGGIQKRWGKAGNFRKIPVFPHGVMAARKDPAPFGLLPDKRRTKGLDYVIGIASGHTLAHGLFDPVEERGGSVHHEAMKVVFPQILWRDEV